MLSGFRGNIWIRVAATATSHGCLQKVATLFIQIKELWLIIFFHDDWIAYFKEGNHNCENEIDATCRNYC